jgi:hypothetical protein
MQAWVNANPGKQFFVTPGAFLGVNIPLCSETRQLAISYHCVADDSSMLYFTASPGGAGRTSCPGGWTRARRPRCAATGDGGPRPVPPRLVGPGHD